jgi:hypothetical protein
MQKRMTNLLKNDIIYKAKNAPELQPNQLLQRLSHSKETNMSSKYVQIKACRLAIATLAPVCCMEKYIEREAPPHGSPSAARNLYARGHRADL